jgi:hypothetical protein
VTAFGPVATCFVTLQRLDAQLRPTRRSAPPNGGQVEPHELA